MNLCKGLEEIGRCAFWACTRLQEISIPPIKDYAFYQCISLTDASLGEGLEEIGGSAFAWCTSLQEILIPSGIRALLAVNDCESWQGAGGDWDAVIL